MREVQETVVDDGDFEDGKAEHGHSADRAQPPATALQAQDQHRGEDCHGQVRGAREREDVGGQQQREHSRTDPSLFWT